MYEIFGTIFLSVVVLGLSYRLGQQSNFVMNGAPIQCTVRMSSSTKKLLCIKKQGKLRLLGVVYHFVATIPVFLMGCAMMVVSLVYAVKVVFDLHFLWFTKSAIAVGCFSSAAYAMVMLMVFSLISRIRR